jgi:hypothetical protein
MNRANLNNESGKRKGVLQEYDIKDHASVVHRRSSIGATFVYC